MASNTNGGVPTLDPFHHTSDNGYFEIFESLPHKIALPELYPGGISKFQILLLLAAVITASAFIWLGRKMKNGDTPIGTMWNFLESILFFIRDEVARPAIGDHEGDKYVPFLTTTFFFILICNLLGMIPFLGSPTGSIAVTAALSLVSFAVTHWAGISENGVGGYIKSFIPHIELDGPAKIMGLFLIPLIAVLEFATPFIRAFVMSVRLFANLMAGHMALYILMFFITMVSKPDWVASNGAPEWLYYVVAPACVTMVTILNLLELMVAGLQAFIFTLLTAIFIGLAKHPAH
jgi:F-type H+-transporting ATPase subunit a